MFALSLKPLFHKITGVTCKWQLLLWWILTNLPLVFCG